MSFEIATRRDAFLRLMLQGPAGSGKTWIALLIATMLGELPGLADAEAGAAKKYACKAGTKPGPGNWLFRHEVITDKTPKGYQAVLGKAAAAGLSTLILDSYSHSWLGALDQVDKMPGASKFTGGWKVVSPQVSKLVEQLLAYPGHLIATARSKAEYVLEKNEKGQSIPKKIGMAPVARDGTDYEFDLVFELTPDQPDGTAGNLTCTKSRAGAAIKVGQVFERDEIPALVKAIKGWLDVGAPLSALERILQRVGFCQTLPDLQALIPEIKALSPEDRAALKPTYDAKKLELTQAAELAGDVP